MKAKQSTKKTAGKSIAPRELEREAKKEKQVESFYHVSEDNFYSLLESAPDAMLIVNETGMIMVANRQSEKIFGYAPAELVGQSVEILLPEGLHKVHRKHRADYFGHPQTRSMGAGTNPVLIARRKDGTKFSVEISLSPFESELGLSVIASVRDITERTSDQESLRAAANKVLAIFSSIEDGITVSDSKGHILEVNDAVARLHGFENKEEILKIGISELVSDADRDRLRTEGLMVLKSGGSSVFECKLRRKDGSLFDGELRLTRLGDIGKATPTIIGITRDITQRKRMEAALLRQNEYLATLHEITLGLINHRDPDTLLEAILNHAASLMRARHALVDIVDPLNNVLIQRVATGNFTLQLGFRTLKGQGLAGRVWDSGKELIIPDYSQWSGGFSEFSWIRSAASFPMKVQGKVIGVIGLAFDEPDRAFAPEEIDLLRRFANLASIALDNAQLITSAIRQSQELRLLHDVRTAITSELSLSSIIKSTVEAIAETFGYTLVSLYLREGNSLVLQHQVGYDQVIRTIPMTQGIIGRVIRTSESVLLEDIRSDPSFLAAVEGIVSEVAVPIIDEGLAVGVLNIESRYGVKLTEADLRLMRALSDQLSIAVGRVRLYDSLERNNDRLAVLHEISIELLNPRDLDDLLQTITDQGLRLLDAAVGYISLKDGDELIDRAVSPRDLPYDKTKVRRSPLESPIRRVYETREIFITTDYSSLPHIRPQTAALGVKAMLLLPITSGDSCYGVLGFGRFESIRPFNEEDIKFANLFAKLTAVALDNAQLRESLRQETLRDPLTGLFNRRFMREVFAQELHKAKRGSHALAVVMLDLDLFKELNDTFGHDAGDEALRSLGTLLQSNVRGSDIACRFGGEEFTLILPEVSLQDALQRMEQLRNDLKQLVIFHQGKQISALSGSFGIAVFPQHGSTDDELLKAADQALYRAKQNGRDQVILAK